MKRVITLIAFLTMSVPAVVKATIWRVNNTTGINANFTSLQTANDDGNVVNGDTLHLEGSSIEYSTCTFNKRLVVIGPGYFLSENPKTSVNALHALVDAIFLSSGASGSTFIGLTARRFEVSANDVTIQRCRILQYVYPDLNYSNMSIVQNFFDNTTTLSTGISTFWALPTGVVVNNNIFKKILYMPGNSSYTFQECKNNVFDVPVVWQNDPSLRFFAASFENNIITNSSAVVDINGISDFVATPLSSVNHNVSITTNTQFGTANDNIVVSNMTANLFVPANISNSTDGKYQLKANSPGSGNGSDGTDRGAFGTSSAFTQYTLSGLAPIPVVYEINTTGIANTVSGLPVTIKARTNNGGVSNIVSAEYFFDTDPGFGNGNQVTFTNPSPDGTFSFDIPANQLLSGNHKLFIRVRDNIGADVSLTAWKNVNVIIVPVSVEKLDRPNYRVYPVPAQKFLNVELSRTTQEEAQLSLTDISGRVLQQVVTHGRTATLMLDYPSGVYFLSVTGNGSTSTEQIIINN
ncbi:MAG: T9SS type A sorting domain-containing protein [Flavipsychrobacter sp.]|nr:T9SS type A sorting domain-containing protein [Flavipsychrobacter sp.]